MSTVYLAGPIAGCSYDEAMDWRSDAATVLNAYGIDTLSPMRAKEALRDVAELSSWDYPEHGPLSSGSVYARDLFDVRRSDVLLANLTGVDRVSIGTMFELGYATALTKYIVVVMEPENVHKHIFVSQSAGIIVSTMAEALRSIVIVMR